MVMKGVDFGMRGNGDQGGWRGAWTAWKWAWGWEARRRYECYAIAACWARDLGRITFSERSATQEDYLPTIDSPEGSRKPLTYLDTGCSSEMALAADNSRRYRT